MTPAREPERPEERTEEEQERLNRQMMELLNELRVAMPGVQILFGFLLTVPFQQRFRQVTEFQETVYFVTLIAAATAAAFLIAPSAYAGTVTMTVVLLATLYLSLWFGFGLVRRVQK